MVWDGVGWCGVVWYGVVWCGMVWYGMLWCVVVCHGVVWCGMVWYGVVWCGMVWYGVVWCGMVWYGVAWCGMGIACCGDRERSDYGYHSASSTALLTKKVCATGEGSAIPVVSMMIPSKFSSPA
jgi:hypothetical protein